MKKRVILIVLDSVGIGALPDAADFGDAGSNTLGNIRRVRGRLALPNLYRLGLANIEGSELPDAVAAPAGAYGRCAERTHAKDTTCGHWEMAGHHLDEPFRTYPNGFPEDLMRRFEQAIGRGTLGNCVASGTEIIQRLGDEHVRTGKPIVYTSADSVFQIISRPFLGESGNYWRTENRRDYALAPFRDTILDALDRAGHEVVGIGKIEDIFCHRGVTTVDHTKNNPAGIAATQRFLESGAGELIFTNLVDFDMLYGHRNDVEGYAAALEAFDAALPAMLGALREGDLLMVTADHGCDPTTPGTDHTREYIPLVAAGPRVRAGVNLGTRSTFADIGATVYEHLTGSAWRTGTSFLREIWRD